MNAPDQLLPYGTLDLDPKVQLQPGPPRCVRCYVRGCEHLLRPPTKADRGESCAIHGIRCHLSALRRPTYSYEDARQNIIASPELFASQLVGHPFKYESNRMGQENSEDALTWNVFRSLQEAECLHEIAHWITGQHVEAEPILFLWGICLTDNSFEPWDLLVAARKHFESNLPVVRPLTEPDIALFLPGHYLVLIEAKFTSPNPYYTDGRRVRADALTKCELLDIYCDPRLQILDVGKARKADLVYYQLWRNLVFAGWMALEDTPTTKAYHANLTRTGWENESCEEFRQLVRPECNDRFTHVAWEDIYHLCAAERPELSLLAEYLRSKTTGLQPAFRISTPRQDHLASSPAS